MYSIIYVNRMFQLKEPEIDGSFLINIPKGGIYEFNYLQNRG